MKSCVVIVGRPNVGKSTLFNRLLKARRAIVADTPGVTRDRLFAELQVEEKECLLVDTGGLVFAGEDALQKDVGIQTRAAVDEADIIIFLLDGQSGVSAEDGELARYLRRSGKPILWVINKCESPRVRLDSVDFYALGMDQLYQVSAEHGEGIGTLKEALAELLPPVEEEPENDSENKDELIRVSVVGKPNVGKSSLLNFLVGSDRLTTSERPGTTIDAVQVALVHDQQKYLFLDTAGLRRRARVHERVESLSNVATLRAIDFANIVILMIDAVSGVTDQDLQISALAHEKGKAVVYVLNKIDLLSVGKKKILAELKDDLAERLFGIHRPVMVELSVKSGQGMKRIFPTLKALHEVYSRRIGTGELNRWLSDVVTAHQHPLIYRHPLKFYFATQVRSAPPTFVIFANIIKGIKPSYIRYLENRIIEHFGFYGVPVKLLFRKREGRGRKS
ncbi:MAG: ribosome biogenesis GTPase Der [Deltaproteobacteria bacterium]|nr:ribosome biogenesis GTPase Der [Candidatus Tharpella aukensis]